MHMTSVMQSVQHCYIGTIRRNLIQSGGALSNCLSRPRKKEHPMLDVVMLALGLGFFGVSVSYAYACEEL